MSRFARIAAFALFILAKLTHARAQSQTSSADDADLPYNQYPTNCIYTISTQQSCTLLDSITSV
ncbi:MAG: hypothetical protein ACI9HK_002254 [Pirellulaceae bacterium]|jgi:hypothetical protein